MKERVDVVDYLRGIAMVAMIAIHTCYFFISDKIAFSIWNWGQFAVPVFIFCSAYLFFRKDAKLRDFPSYIKKRYIRLLIPYFTFLVFYIPLVWITKKWSFEEATRYIIKSITLTGGVDINWLVLLFLFLTPIIFLLNVLFSKNRISFFIVSALSFLFATYVLITKVSLDYRYTMWISWSVIPVWTLLFVKYKQSFTFLLSNIIIFFFLFFITYLYKQVTGTSLSFIESKYPPNIYFISYGIVSLLLLYSFARSRLILPFKGIFTFFSTYSYQLYFIHYTVLYVFVLIKDILPFTWYTFFGGVILVSVAIQMLLNRFHFKKAK